MPPAAQPSTIRSLLLVRRGVLSAGGSQTTSVDRDAQRGAGFALELAHLGYVPSARLRLHLDSCSADGLAELHRWVIPALAGHVGGDRPHEPLFRRFPDGIPADTDALWWQKVLVHFLQHDGQPCLSCRRVGTTHVLNPCRHVVCDQCFDGGNYSACPICENHVDRDAPFFQPSPARDLPQERIRFKLLDLGGEAAVDGGSWFQDLCRRTQAPSPDDRQALTTIVSELGLAVLPLVPEVIPLRENMAVIFGTLLTQGDPVAVLPLAARHLKTATDVLRLIAVHSGTDGSLQGETIFKPREQVAQPGRFWGLMATLLGGSAEPQRRTIQVPLTVHRFTVAKLPRRLRRALLTLLEGMPEERLIEDLLRHRSYWVWVGEFLHPHEYAARFPTVARAFQIVRGHAPDGTPAPAHRTWNSRVEQAVGTADVATHLALLLERPGEFARHLDHALRLAQAEPQAIDEVADAFIARLERFATPVLVTLRSHLPLRTSAVAQRVYWPKGAVAKGVFAADLRKPLPPATVQRVVSAIDGELLRRFAGKPGFDQAIIDDALGSVVMPFNERTASPSAVTLPRGSAIAVEPGRITRLFLHWCQPEQGGQRTDIDLSVAFYDAAWRYVGVCSYYELQAHGEDGALIALSAGDLRDAPWPDGATEFVDLHRDAAQAAGIRYAVMVVNNYAGMAFSQLARGFAGIMQRDDPLGSHFDPRTVALRFALQGENGVYLPLVLDVAEGRLHWLDVNARGQFEFNNVAMAKQAIASTCPGLMGYFASGARPSIRDIGLLHAAARCRQVTMRGPTCRTFQRRSDETVHDFHQRLLTDEPDHKSALLPDPTDSPVLALLSHGDIDLPAGSVVFALFRERVNPSLTASDLLS